jgi:hypothetical protein
MPRIVVAVALLAGLAAGAPAQAQYSSCVVQDTYVLSAFLVADRPAQVSGAMRFTPPAACDPGVAGSVAVSLAVFTAGSPGPVPIAFTWSYVVDPGGAVDVGPGILRGRIGHDAGFIQTIAFTADPALPSPALQLAGMAVRETFDVGISSRRFKADVRDLGDASRELRRLRPVTFRYKGRAADGTRPRRYGLIAEEVAAVYPELVRYGLTGRPLTVRYDELPAMLLNEIQRQRRELEAQGAQLEAQAAELAAAAARLARRESR